MPCHFANPLFCNDLVKYYSLIFSGIWKSSVFFTHDENPGKSSRYTLKGACWCACLSIVKQQNGAG